jgi:phosphoribosylglycinamide formyltransferase-1
LTRLGVHASGSGTNLQALLDGCSHGQLDARVEVVISNVPGALALSRAERAGARAVLLPSSGQADRAAYDRRLLELLVESEVDLVCLAGYLRIVSPAFLSAFGPIPGTRGCPRVMNIHPGLLPAFPGLHAQRQALLHGSRVAGCTGPIILQAAVPVLFDDTEATLAERILAAEHRAYPQAVRWFAQGRLSLAGRRVRVDGVAEAMQAALFGPPLDAP